MVFDKIDFVDWTDDLVPVIFVSIPFFLVPFLHASFLFAYFQQEACFLSGTEFLTEKTVYGASLARSQFIHRN